MNEELLYYIWQQKLFNHSSLNSTAGEPLSIVQPGLRNHDSGPDFTQARIRINTDLLVGNVEIHVKSSDWEKHKHQNDKAYSNIVLHVVYENDSKSLSVIPTLELKNKIDERFLDRYKKLMQSQSWIPCETQLKGLESLFIKSGLHRILIERLEAKTSEIRSQFTTNKNNSEETFYQSTARTFGLKANAEIFEMLAKSLPLMIVGKHKNNLTQIESLLFGQAGFLSAEFKDDYPNQLKKEYSFLQKKYALKPLESHLWKFMRLRPASFPTIRIAQFAKLLHQSSHLFSKILEMENVEKIAALFKVEPSDYWRIHYRFDLESANKKKAMGEDFIKGLIINAIVPSLFIYGKSKGDQQIQDKAVNLLEQLTAEKNNIVNKWRTIGISCCSAYESQALLQLKNGYCNHKKCLKCHIGNRLLKS